MRVLLADADESFAKLVRSVFAGEAEIILVGCAVNAEQTIERAFQYTPDVVFLAIDMARSIEAAQHILRLMPKPPKIILMGPQDQESVAAMATADVSGYGMGLAATAGASGYMTKTADGVELLGLVAALAALAMASGDWTNGN